MGIEYPPIKSESTIEPELITPTGSPMTIVNNISVDIDILISGGTVTLIQFKRGSFSALTLGLLSGMIRLSPNDSAIITYIVAPTIHRVRR